MFPINSISTSTEISGDVTYVLVSTSSPTTIYGVRLQQSLDNSTTKVECVQNGGKAIVAMNYAKDYPLDLLNLSCTGNISIVKTGNDTAFVSLTYGQTRVLSTNTPMYINGFSYGEIMIGLFLLAIATGAFFGGILNRVVGVKQKAVHKQKI